jgi:hypothetical protein
MLNSKRQAGTAADSSTKVEAAGNVRRHNTNAMLPAVPLLKWLRQVKKEQKHYALFKGRELNPDMLQDLWQQGKSPINALNDLSTAC